MTWTPCPFWPECGAAVEFQCPECDAEFDDDVIEFNEWIDSVIDDEQEEHAGGEERGGYVGMDGGRWVPVGEVVGKVMERLPIVTRKIS